MRVIATLVWYHKAATKRGARLQLNDIAAGSAGESLFDALPRTYHPSLSGCGSVFQGARYTLPWQLCGAIEIAASGGRGGLTRTRGTKGRSEDQQKKNNPWRSHAPAGILHACRFLLMTILTSRSLAGMIISDHGRPSF
jgi:hypothetical protein